MSEDFINFEEAGVRVPKSVRLEADAQKVIAVLMEEGGDWQGTKEQFAYKMDWYLPNGGADRTRVTDVCTFTRDQEALSPRVRELLGGFVITYSSIGKPHLTLVDPEDGMSLSGYLHMLNGDLARQKQHKTENKRRRYIWQQGSKAAEAAGDFEMATLMARGQQAIDLTGSLPDNLENQIRMAAMARVGGD